MLRVLSSRWRCLRSLSAAVCILPASVHACCCQTNTPCIQLADATCPGWLVQPALQAAQRRYVLLALWMARYGAGVLPGKAIVDAARRLRVS